jgi:hypothetical protein
LITAYVNVRAATSPRRRCDQGHQGSLIKGIKGFLSFLVIKGDLSFLVVR